MSSRGVFILYVPKKQSQPGTYEGIWSGPIAIPVALIRPSHKTRPEQRIAKGYENVPIRIQPIDNSDQYLYQIVDGNKRLKKAKHNATRMILAYIWEGKDDAMD